MFNKFIIRKNNLINNIKQVKLENPNSKICAMVKANAYGVGIKHVVQILEDYVDFFGVACFFEAEEIKNLTNKKILITGAVEKGCVNEHYSYTCADLEDLNYLISLKKPINIHLKVNTGMNRYGFKDIKSFKKAVALISHSSLIIEGLYTHFATTDEYVLEQMKEFKRYIKVCNSFGFYPIVHADNSFVNEKYNHNLDMVRIGFNLYNRDEGWLLPVVEIKSKVAQIQEVKKGELVGYGRLSIAKQKLKVAIVPVGYADGFDMKFVGLNLQVNGKQCKILNICMDCFLLDVSNVNIQKGDDIIILNKFNPLKKFADYIETSVYEIMTKFSNIRAERIID